MGRAAAGLIIILGLAVTSFLLVGQFAARDEGFDWELASLFGTAVGTVLLATATGLLAWMTRAEVVASRQELELSRTAYQASTRPILLDAPLDTFTVEKEIAFGTFPIEQGVPRRLEDLGRITVTAGEYSSRDEPVGHASIMVPFHNVGAGLALIHDARVVRFESGWPIHWRRTSMQSGAPPGQLARVGFDANIDPGDGAVLGFELEQGDELISFSVEVTYSDFGGGQRTRTRVAITGRRGYWRVTNVELFDGDSTQPFVSLHREALAVTGEEASPPQKKEG
jgi:hypothetical protein